MSQNPVFVEATRGGIVESQHRGAFAVVSTDGTLAASAGDIEAAIFPRSAIKAFQALPVVEGGAADRFGFTPEEIALCCASHGGEPRHTETAARMLSKVGVGAEQLECGGHWPSHQHTTNCMLANGERFGQIHNNCSGKHAGMQALSAQLGVDPSGYTGVDHPVQQAIRETIQAMCEVDLTGAPVGFDGCSVPTWAFPLKNMALGFAKLGAGQDLPKTRRDAADRIIAAVREHPFMVAGTARACTALMEAVPRVFVKIGAEGVYCACVPHAGLGIALKCESGSSDAAEIAIAGVLAALPVWTQEEQNALVEMTFHRLRNRREIEVGALRRSQGLADLSIQT
ncbi:MAG: asparaginase [Alphaproteobacteria bacterium]|nr:asparaginase [Alphaproteobacteria bacterium]